MPLFKHTHTRQRFLGGKVDERTERGWYSKARTEVRVFLLTLEPRSVKKAGISFDGIALYFEAKLISDESPPSSCLTLAMADDITFKH